MKNIFQIKSNIVFAYLFLSLIFSNFLYDFLSFNLIDEVLLILYTLSGMMMLFYGRNKIFSITPYVLFFFLFYLFYSLCLAIQSPSAILYDFCQQLKPFMCFCITYSLFSKLGNLQRKILRVFVLLLALLSVCLYIVEGGYGNFWKHPSYYGLAMFNFSFSYYIFSTRDRRSKIIFIVVLSLGLLCLRSKFIGSFIATIYFFYFAKYDSANLIKRKILLLSFVVLAIGLTWTKLELYIINGFNIETPQVRNILYVGAFLVAYMFFPFGAGLATFANEASRTFYSPLYDELQISNIYGLSREYPNFIADTFYPTVIAQFGLGGIILYIMFWRSVLKTNYKNNFLYYREDYKLALSFIVMILIEMSTNSSILSSKGTVYMTLLACLISKNKRENSCAL